MATYLRTDPSITQQEERQKLENLVGPLGDGKGGGSGGGAGGNVQQPKLTKQQQELQRAQQKLVTQAYKNPSKLVTKPDFVKQKVKGGELIAEGTGQLSEQDPFAQLTQAGQAKQAGAPAGMDTATYESASVFDKVAQEGQMAAATGQVSPDAVAQAAQLNTQELAQLGLTPAQIEQAVQILKPEALQLQAGELIEGSPVDMARVQEQTEIQAAQAQPSKLATVEGQLEQLYQDFDAKNPPAWAAGAMRAATAKMAQRGLAPSSMAAQAVVQAAMESALPIAAQDASTYTSFEQQNLSNRQQAAMAAAQQRAEFLGLEFNQEFQSRVANASRISDIANMNFTAEQQVALENAQLAQTVDLANLSSKQAKVMADAAALTQVDSQNLSNRQQAQQQKAQAFLQMDLSNLSNEQQAAVINSQALVQSLLSDQAAENAAQQFNATSENQVEQFMRSLETQIEQFNATQQNAMIQFDVNESNAMQRFNSELENQRDQFNAQNSLLISQANAQWRQRVNTINTQTKNAQNMQYAQQVTGVTLGTLDQIWQRERDLMTFAFQSSENTQSRNLELLLADKRFATTQYQVQAEQQMRTMEGLGMIVGNLLFGGVGGLGGSSTGSKPV